jgi:hypothetical protein
MNLTVRRAIYSEAVPRHGPAGAPQKRPLPVAPGLRAPDQSGSATPLTLLLGTTFIVLPVMILVLTLPAWEQRVVDAQDAARSAARALVTADNWGDGVSAANQAVAQLVSGDGLPSDDLSVTYSGSLYPGGTVTAAVTVVIPAGNLPGLGFVGELHYTASSTAHVDSYRDSST